MTDLITYAYPCVLEPQEDGEILVRFPDWPEALTSGDTEAEALANATDALDEAAAALIVQGEGLPVPSGHKADQHLIPLPEETALRGLIAGWVHDRGHGAFAALSRALGKDERHARRLLDPRASVSYSALSEAARAIGLAPTVTLVFSQPDKVVRHPGDPAPKPPVKLETAVRS